MLVTLLGRSTTVRGRDQKRTGGECYVSDAATLTIWWCAWHRNTHGRIVLGISITASEARRGKMATLRGRFLSGIGPSVSSRCERSARRIRDERPEHGIRDASLEAAHRLPARLALRQFLPMVGPAAGN